MSKAVENLMAGNYMPELTPRERIKAHYATKGKVPLTELDEKIIERCERVKDILLEQRANLAEAKRMIKEEFGFTHRSEVDRAIEDAQYLLGAMFKVEKQYQRLVQLNDIEFWMQFAKEKKDGYLAAEMMKRREKLFKLDEEDKIEDNDYFSSMVIVQQFKEDEFLHTLRPGYQERIGDKKQALLIAAGLAEDVAFTETKDE